MEFFVLFQKDCREFFFQCKASAFHMISLAGENATLCHCLKTFISSRFELIYGNAINKLRRIEKMSSNVGKIKLKSLSDLISVDESSRASFFQDVRDIGDAKTPVSVRTTNGKRKVGKSSIKIPNFKVNGNDLATPKTPAPRKAMSSKKQIPPNQMRIDKFFQSASKTFPASKEVTDGAGAASTVVMENGNSGNQRESKMIARKRLYLSKEDLFDDEDEKTESEDSTDDDFDIKNKKSPKGRKKRAPRKKNKSAEKKTLKKSPAAATTKTTAAVTKDVIDLCSESEGEGQTKTNGVTNKKNKTPNTSKSSPKKKIRKITPKSKVASEKSPIKSEINKEEATPDSNQNTPMFAIPSALATTKRRLRQHEANVMLGIESTPSLWQNKTKAEEAIAEEEHVEDISNGKKKCNDLIQTPVTALSTPAVKKSKNTKTAKRQTKAHKRKISFSALDSKANLSDIQEGEQEPKSKLKTKSELEVEEEVELEGKEGGESKPEREAEAEEADHEPEEEPKIDIVLNESDGLTLIEDDSREGIFDLGKNRCILKPSILSATIAKTSTSKTVEQKVSSDKNETRRKPKVPPAFKIINETTFAVDAFCYGYIEGITHYFLTHYHADHYNGLTRKFAMPLYASPITARLIQAFTPIDEQYLHIIEVNQTKKINGIEVTAIDANHCPGAVMFVFKLPDGKCLLHTGDFRACPDMESEPIFWNNHINTIYLDTTYISDKYAFCTQYESIDKAIDIVYKFKLKHQNKKILYVCGSYVIGKEKFWLALVEEFGIKKVWTEGNRRKALDAIDNPVINKVLCNDPNESTLHVIALGKLNYQSLKTYFEDFQDDYDIMLAFRPSGWEKNSKPQYRGAINIVGIEYSEHSSYEEMQRFVKYLKPDHVISTVPFGGYNSTNTPQVPLKWYKYDKLTGKQKNFQTSISSYLKMPSKTSTVVGKPVGRPRGRPRKIKPIQEQNLVEVSSPVKSTPMALIGSINESSTCDTITKFEKKEQDKEKGLEPKTSPAPNEDHDYILRNLSENEDENPEECITIYSSDTEGEAEAMNELRFRPVPNIKTENFDKITPSNVESEIESDFIQQTSSKSESPSKPDDQLAPKSNLNYDQLP